MTEATILSALENALAAELLSAHHLRLLIAEDPSTALSMLSASPEGGVVVINPGSDDAPDAARGTATDLNLNVTVQIPRGLQLKRGDDLHKERPSGRDPYFTIFRDVIALFRRVHFVDAGGNSHPQIQCQKHLRYLGSDWLVKGEEDAPIRERTARFVCRYAFDPAGQLLAVPLE